MPSYVVTSYFGQFVDHWQSLIAGVFALFAAIAAVLLAIWNERRKAKREFASLRRSLGVEVRQYTWNACRAHVQLKALLLQPVSPIPAIFVEDKSKLPPPQIYPNAVMRIGEFGDCAANIVLFYNRIGVTREAAERLLRLQSKDNLPPGEVAWAVEGLIRISEVGIEILPHLKTGIATEDGPDADVTKRVQSELGDWTPRRAEFGVS
jgi:hypothetical protein